MRISTKNTRVINDSIALCQQRIDRAQRDYDYWVKRTPNDSGLNDTLAFIAAQKVTLAQIEAHKATLEA